MGVGREFDEAKTMLRIDTFIEALGIEKKE